MADVTEHAFQPGVVVAVVPHTYSAPRPMRRVVAKVHKTGRFVLEGSTDQWRVRDNGTAVVAGGSRWSHPDCEIWSAKHDEMLAAALRLDRYRAALDYLRTARVETPAEDITAAVEALAALVKAHLESES